MEFPVGRGADGEFFERYCSWLGLPSGENRFVEMFV